MHRVRTVYIPCCLCVSVYNLMQCLSYLLGNYSGQRENFGEPDILSVHHRYFKGSYRAITARLISEESLSFLLKHIPTYSDPRGLNDQPCWEVRLKLISRQGQITQVVISQKEVVHSECRCTIRFKTPVCQGVVNWTEKKSGQRASYVCVECRMPSLTQRGQIPMWTKEEARLDGTHLLVISVWQQCFTLDSHVTRVKLM